MPKVKRSQFNSIDPDEREGVIQLMLNRGWTIEDDEPELAPAKPGDLLRQRQADIIKPVSKMDMLKDPTAIGRTAARVGGNALGGAISGASFGPAAAAVAALLNVGLGELTNAGSEKLIGKDESPLNFHDALNLIPTPPGVSAGKRIAADAGARGVAEFLNGLTRRFSGSEKLDEQGKPASKPLGENLFNSVAQAAGTAGMGTVGRKLAESPLGKAETYRKAHKAILDYFSKNNNTSAFARPASKVVENAQEIAAGLGGGVQPRRITEAIKAEEALPSLLEEQRIAREAEKLSLDKAQDKLSQTASSKDLDLAVLREARDKEMNRELDRLEAQLQTEITSGVGRNSQKAQALRSQIEATKAKYAAPSAREQAVLAAQNNALTDDLSSLKDAQKLSEAKRQNQLAAQEKKVNYLDDLTSRTGIDVRNIDDARAAVIKKVAAHNPKAIYDDAVGFLFQDATLTDLQKRGAPKFREIVSDLQQVAGKPTKEIETGVRNAFFRKIFADTDSKSGLIKNPDSLRYRVEAMGKESFNSMFGNPEGDSYDVAMKLFELASRGGAQRRMREKIGFTSMGRMFINISSGDDKPFDIHLNKDGPNLSNIPKGALAGASIGGMSTFATGGSPLLGAGVGALLGGGAEGLQWTFQTLLEAAANKNSRVGKAVTILADPASYSSSQVQDATRTFISMSDNVREKMKNPEETKNKVKSEISRWLQ